MKTITLTAQPADRKRGLTLDEVGAFVQLAHREGVPGDARVAATVGMRGQIIKAEIRSEREGR